MKKILIIGSWTTTHVRRFLTIICKTKEDDLIIDAFDPSYEDGQGNVCGVNHVYRVTASPLARKIFSIRKIGTLLKCWREHRTLAKLLSSNEYDLVNIHSLPKDCLQLVKIAHKHNVKIMLTPFGSDVLRLESFNIPMMRKAFDAADFVGTNTITSFCQTIKEKFSIDEAKFVNLGYGSETISAIIDMKGKFTREELAQMIDAPSSPYYVCCGYNASSAQHQSEMIDAIDSVKDYLPGDFCLLFPLTYGQEKEALYKKLSAKCMDKGLKAYFLTDFLTVDQVAALRLITDLFIHIQPTDAYNASLQEYLLSGAKVINGEWLKYPSLEQYGLPYYLCHSIDTLSQDIIKLFSEGEVSPVLSSEIVPEIESNAWSNKINDWISFYESI